MKKIVLLFACIAIATGCNDSTPVANQSDSSSVDEKTLEQAREYGKRLLDLRDQARHFESEMNFSAAAEVWQQVVKRVSTDFGENSWQAINAKIAHKSAVKKQALKNQYARELAQIAALETGIVNAHQQQQTQRALELSRQLLALQQPLVGDVSMETARVKIQIGTLESKLELDELAQSNLHDGIEIFREKGIELHPELEAALASLADVYTRREKFAPAVANQKAATKIAGHIWGLDSLQYATQANQLGVIFHQAGNDDVAFDILDAAKTIREKKLGTDNLEYARSCLNTGIVALAQQKLIPAQEQLTVARNLFVQKLGPANDFSVRSSTQLATTMMLLNRPDITEKLLTEVVNAVGNSASREQMADYRYKLAIALARQGKYNQAEPMLQQTLNEQQTLHGATSTQAVNSMKALARLFEATHQKSKLAAIQGQINQVTRVADSSDFQPRY